MLPFDKHHASPTINYSELSFTLTIFKIFKVVDDRFSHLTAARYSAQLGEKMSSQTIINYDGPFDWSLRKKDTTWGRDLH